MNARINNMITSPVLFNFLLYDFNLTIPLLFYFQFLAFPELISWGSYKIKTRMNIEQKSKKERERRKILKKFVLPPKKYLFIVFS